MVFLMSNGAPATFAVERETAIVILGTDEVQEVPLADFSARDWAAAEALWFSLDSSSRYSLDDESRVKCFAVAC
jgi:hypothetical protein